MDLFVVGGPFSCCCCSGRLVAPFPVVVGRVGWCPLFGCCCSGRLVAPLLVLLFRSVGGLYFVVVVRVGWWPFCWCCCSGQLVAPACCYRLCQLVVFVRSFRLCLFVAPLLQLPSIVGPTRSVVFRSNRRCRPSVPSTSQPTSTPHTRRIPGPFVTGYLGYAFRV